MLYPSNANLSVISKSALRAIMAQTPQVVGRVEAAPDGCVLLWGEPFAVDFPCRGVQHPSARDGEGLTEFHLPRYC